MLYQNILVVCFSLTTPSLALSLSLSLSWPCLPFFSFLCAHHLHSLRSVSGVCFPFLRHAHQPAFARTNHRASPSCIDCDLRARNSWNAFASTPPLELIKGRICMYCAIVACHALPLEGRFSPRPQRGSVCSISHEGVCIATALGITTGSHFCVLFVVPMMISLMTGHTQIPAETAPAPSCHQNMGVVCSCCWCLWARFSNYVRGTIRPRSRGPSVVS